MTLGGTALAPIAFMITLVVTAIAVVHHTSVRPAGARPAKGETDTGWILDVVLALHIAVYAWITLEPQGPGPASFSLVPLAELAPTFQDWFTHWLPQHGLAQVPPEVMHVATNFLLLAPFAAIAPLRWPWVASGGRVFGVAAGIAAVSEILQAILGGGRSVAFDDVLMQALGAVAIYAMIRGALKSRERRLAQNAEHS